MMNEGNNKSSGSSLGVNNGIGGYVAGSQSNNATNLSELRAKNKRLVNRLGSMMKLLYKYKLDKSMSEESIKAYQNKLIGYYNEKLSIANSIDRTVGSNKATNYTVNSKVGYYVRN